MNPLPTAAARCVYLVLVIAVACAFVSAASAQERPFDTTACALTQHPDKYNEGLVSVEGLITVGPDEFMLHDPNCGDDRGKIWLEFGGGVESPGATPSAHLAKNRPGPSRVGTASQQGPRLRRTTEVIAGGPEIREDEDAACHRCRKVFPR